LCDETTCAERIEATYRVPLATTQAQAVTVAAPLVSVIIPLFNQGQWLPEALASALASSYPALEVVVVNDGSTDQKTVRAFERIDDPRVRKVAKANGGLASARNAGIAAASGEFILPLDADDRIHPDYVAIAVGALQRNPELAFVTCYVKNFGELDSHYVPLGLVPELMLLLNPAGKCTSMFRRRVFEELGGYDEAMVSFEDWDVLCRIAAAGLPADVIPKTLFYYRRHRDSMVYSEALPRQAPLMQYMVTRNPKLLQQHGERLLRVAIALHFGVPISINATEKSPWQIEAECWMGEAQRLARCWSEQKSWIDRLESRIRVLEAGILRRLLGKAHGLLRRITRRRG
jgi:GT2 family glycosyltransferase